ncbi:MAG: hypothetical protein COW65_18590, partial [Cytophagales bacterium CG18_big_fil_WC_8_21_14_2_50_42_9]
FKINFREALLKVKVSKEGVQITNDSDIALTVMIYDKPYEV